MTLAKHAARIQNDSMRVSRLSKLSKLSIVCLAAGVLHGCSGDAASNAEGSHATPGASDGAPEPGAASGDPFAAPVLDAADWNATWRQLSIPSASFGSLQLRSTPTGWFAVSSHDFEEGKIGPSYESVMYRSSDGVHWSKVSLVEGGEPLTHPSLAYGGGHYVITGARGASNVALSSLDGETWREQVFDEPYLNNPGSVRYSGGRFFSMGFSFWSSLDGESWTRLEHPYMFSSFVDIAFGGTQYLGVGLATLLSVDGVTWQLAPIDCALPGACYSTPEGLLEENGHGWVFYAEGRYYVDGFSSADGHSWEVLPAPSPNAYVSGQFVTLTGRQFSVWLGKDAAPHPIEWQARRDRLPAGVSAADARRWSWPPAEDMDWDDFPLHQPMPDSLDFSWDDGLDCARARCVIVESTGYPQLYLVP